VLLEQFLKVLMTMPTPVCCPLVPVHFKNTVVHPATSAMVEIVLQALDLREQVLDELGVILDALSVMMQARWEIDVCTGRLILVF